MASKRTWWSKNRPEQWAKQKTCWLRQPKQTWCEAIYWHLQFKSMLKHPSLAPPLTKLVTSGRYTFLPPHVSNELLYPEIQPWIIAYNLITIKPEVKDEYFKSCRKTTITHDTVCTKKNFFTKTPEKKVTEQNKYTDWHIFCESLHQLTAKSQVNESK